MFILGIPIFDTLFVMYIRYRRGLPILWGSPDHIAIRLRHWGMSVPQIVITSYVATAVVGMIGLAMLSVSQEGWVGPLRGDSWRALVRHAIDDKGRCPIGLSRLMLHCHDSEERKAA